MDTRDIAIIYLQKRITTLKNRLFQTNWKLERLRERYSEAFGSGYGIFCLECKEVFSKLIFLETHHCVTSMLDELDLTEHQDKAAEKN